MTDTIIEALKLHLQRQPVNSSFKKIERAVPGITKLLEQCPGTKLAEKIWNLLHPGEYEKFLTCPQCGKETKKFISPRLGYQTFCSNACAYKDPSVRLAKGSANLNQTPEQKQKKREKIQKINEAGGGLKGMREKVAKILLDYTPGDEHKIASPEELKELREILPTIKQNCFSTLPISHPRAFELIKDFYGRSFSEKLYSALNPGVRARHLKCEVCQRDLDSYVTFLKGYRTYCSNKCSMEDEKRKARAMAGFWTDESKKKRSVTLIAHFGTNSMIDINRIKALATMQKNYGVDYPSQSQELRDRAKAAVIEKYGVDNVWKNPEVQAKCAATLFKNHGVTSPLQLVDWSEINVTKWQEEISYMLTELKIDHLLNDRTMIAPDEIDIYCPSLKIGIELNGLYWHTERSGKNSSYHLLKQQRCEDQGIKLIQIFSDEWANQKIIVIGRLLAILGKAEKIYARKCLVEEIKYKEAVAFMNETHIQGMVSGSHNLGLRRGGELMALLVMGSPRFNKNYKWELLRYSSIVGTVVVGGASKLLTHFLKENPGSVISYADRRWSQGNLYRALGFKEKSRTAPSHAYVDPSSTNRINLYKVRGEKIKKYVNEEIYDPRLTEAANMQLAGYERIFDCGSLVFIKD